MAQLDLANMVLNDITVDIITNANKTGVFDKLMDAVNDNINIQYEQNRINSTDYATVYLGSLQTVLTQSIQFGLQEQLLEAQVANAIADNDLKIKQLEVITTEQAMKQFELDSILPEQLIKLQEETDLLQTQDNELLLNGVKDRLLKDVDISMKGKQEDQIDEQILVSKQEVIKNTYEVVTLLPDQHTTNIKQQILLDTEEELKTAQKDEVLAVTVRKDSELVDNLLTAVKQRLVLDEQVTKLQEEVDLLITQDNEMLLDGVKNRLLKDEQIETEALNNGIDGTIANQILDIKKVVDVKERQMLEAEATGAKQRLILDEELQTADLQQILLATEEELKTAQLIEVSDATIRANTQLDDQRLTTYTDRILKDKQAAKLGLDNVMKQSETSRAADPTFVYKPKYTEI